MNRRVLITGVGGLWGAELAAQLEADPDTDEIVAIDREEPARPLTRTDYVRADLRHNLVGKLIRALGIDTVVHAATILDSRRSSRREVHEHNVIGTMNLLAACGGSDSPVRNLVVISSTAIYSTAPDAPSLWSEEMERPRPDDPFARDLEEMETYVDDFATRWPQTAVTVLRFADVLGRSDETPFGAYFSLRMLPAVAGFDPRLQFIHEDDAVAALAWAVDHPYRGAVNVAGRGVVTLSQAASMVRRRLLPIIPFAGTRQIATSLRRAQLLPLPDHLIGVLQHGRVAETERLRADFGFSPRRSSIECVQSFARWRRTRAASHDPFTHQSDVETFLHARAADHPNGHHPSGRLTTPARGSS